MILRIILGEEAIEVDDDNNQSRPTPEWIDDTLGRMRRTFDQFHRDNLITQRAIDSMTEASD